ncbi:hypothetical protein [Pseudorhizobium banfieldiae]|uniref:hypothetical protein n=1 Tax=Pseudorhizobium banfieldiae TaxID=1125847 RepID=UPI0015621A22|nr:hypothetical protein [Pseudorhizobium banfieldiae]
MVTPPDVQSPWESEGEGGVGAGAGAGALGETGAGAATAGGDELPEPPSPDPPDPPEQPLTRRPAEKRAIGPINAVFDMLK